MYGLETTTISADLNLAITIGVLILQLYISLKISPIKKDIEYLKEENKERQRENEKRDEDLKGLYDRCYENHKEHGKRS